MYAELYISSVEGLEEHDYALEKLAHSQYIDGIENNLSLDGIRYIKTKGLKYTTQDPMMKSGATLSDEGFLRCITQDVIERCKLSDTEHVQFQGFSKKKGLEDMAFHEIKRNISYNSDALRRTTGKNIAMEVMPFTEYLKSEEVNAVYDMVYNPKMLKNIARDIGIGITLDIPHMIMTCDMREKTQGMPMDAHDYYRSMIECLSDYIVNMRVSVPGRNGDHSYEDSNLPLSDDEDGDSNLVCSLTREAYEKCPNLESITLDIRTDSRPVEHVSYMEEQVNELLDILGDLPEPDTTSLISAAR